jgi:peptidyl-prolyl cis-trans isomerase C
LTQDDLLKTHAFPIVVAVVLVSLTACNKGSAEQTPAGQTPAGQAGAQPAAAQPPAPPKPVPAQLPDVVARVNGKDVSKADFERLVRNVELGRGPIPAERRDEVLRAVLEQLITYNVLKQEAETRGVTINAADIDAEVAKMKQQFPSEDEFKKALAARNSTVEQLKADARVDMTINKMIEGELTGPDATEADAKDFYDKNPDKFKQGESVRASHILVMAKDDADAAAKQAARAKIDAVLKRVKAGEDFAKLARENSDDGSKDQGGDLGFFERGKMVPEFEKAAFALKPGEVSDVVASPFGFHIIKVAEKKDATTVPFEQVKGRLVPYLTEQKKQERGQAFVEAAKKKSKIEVLI